MATVLITGGTGLVGTAITKQLLNRNYDVIILTRFPEKYSVDTPRLSYAAWDVENQVIDTDAILKADYIIHLAGANVGEKRWTSRRKNEILESRTKGSQLIVKALKENINNIKAIVSASAIGWYGPGDGALFKETDPPSEDFLGITCKDWEAGIDPVTSLGKRLVTFRTGIVLSKTGGVLKEFKRPLRFGIAAIMGNGRQVVSWIHIEDLVGLYIYAIENEKLHGVYNAVAPLPVTNKKLVLELAKKMKGKFYVSIFIPSVILKIIFGEMSIEILKSATVSSQKIKKEGYTFLYPSIKSAMKQIK
ncbi:MAG TPA: TIGR01777 family oxidoreductase [Chitinophagaceae bacterium]|nr:TIGR01777 family oxidoreductase [Chitinophagaceae bacterium]